MIINLQNCKVIKKNCFIIFCLEYWNFYWVMWYVICVICFINIHFFCETYFNLTKLVYFTNIRPRFINIETIYFIRIRLLSKLIYIKRTSFCLILIFFKSWLFIFIKSWLFWLFLFIIYWIWINLFACKLFDFFIINFIRIIFIFKN